MVGLMQNEQKLWEALKKVRGQPKDGVFIARKNVNEVKEYFMVLRRLCEANKETRPRRPKGSGIFQGPMKNRT